MEDGCLKRLPVLLGLTVHRLRRLSKLHKFDLSRWFRKLFRFDLFRWFRRLSRFDLARRI